MENALKVTREQFGRAVTAARELGLKITEAEAKGKPTAEMQETFDKAMADVTRLKLRAQQMEEQATIEREAATVVNAPVSRPGEKHEKASGDDEGRREVFNAYLRYGERHPAYYAVAEKHRESHALMSAQGTVGGALVPEDFRAEVVKNLGGITVMRMSGARVVPVSGSVLVYPSIAGGTNPYSTGVAGAWRAEGAQGTDGTAPSTQDQPTFGQERIPVHVWQPNAIVVTRELLEDSAVPLESILAQSIAEAKGQDEDYAFLKGDGIGRPKGLWQYATDTTVTHVHSGSASALTYDGLLDLVMTLPIQYRAKAVFYLCSSTMGAVLKLKDSSLMPILYSAAMPDTIFGKKVFVSEHVPAVAGSAYPIFFGDPSFYIIAERADLRLQRLEERFAPNVAFLPTARLGGGLVRSQAFVAQYIST